MTGSYVTNSRSTPAPIIRYTTGLVGQAGTTQTLGAYGPAGTETVRSFRTVSREASEQAELENNMRVFRNGFTTNNPVTDRGHEFTLTKTSTELNAGSAYVLSKIDGKPVFYRGPLWPILRPTGVGGATHPTVDLLSTAQRTTFGQRAILNCAPTAPQASAATFIGELFAGLPQMIGSGLWRSNLKDYREVGSEYLNVQFGWIPFLNDLKKIATNLRKATRILRQLQRDNGRVVRRRFAFPTELSTAYSSFTATNGSPFIGVSPLYLGGPSPQIHINTRTERSIWFSGAFSYHIPTDSNVFAKLERFDAMANVLFGSRVTPEVVWNLAPWSWLVDWKMSIGEALGLASRFSEDGLVIRYGYLMVHTKSDSMYSSNPFVNTISGQAIAAQFSTLRSERKERFATTPYGFGVDMGSLSDSQWAILAALGMTKSPRTLA